MIVIYPVLLDLKQRYDSVIDLQVVLNELQEDIISSYGQYSGWRAFKGTWTQRIKDIAAELDVQLVSDAVLLNTVGP